MEALARLVDDVTQTFRNASIDGGKAPSWVNNCLDDHWLARRLYT
jgi:hypothetical protein